MGVTLPIELLPIIRKFEASVERAAKTVEVLDKNIEILNKNIDQLGKSEGIINLQQQLQNTNKALEQSAKSTSVTILTVSERVAAFVASLQQVIEFIKNLVKAFNLIRKVLLPIVLVFGKLGPVFSAVFSNITKAVIELRITIELQLFAIRRSFLALIRSESIEEFILNLNQLSADAENAFERITKGAKDVEQAFRDRFDPAVVVQNLTVFVGAVVAAVESVGLLTKTLTGRNVIQIFGASFQRLGAFISSTNVRSKVFNTTLQLTGKTLNNFGDAALRAGSKNTAFIRSLSGQNLNNFLKTVVKTPGALKIFGLETANIAKRTEIFQKGIIATTARIGFLGGAFIVLGSKLQQSESELVRFTGRFAEFFGLILGPGSLAFAGLISVLGIVANRIGNKLVAANLAATQSFSDAQLANFTFTRTIESFSEVIGTGAIPNTQEWTQVINELNISTGAQIASLQIAATEISAIGSEIGLTTQQQEFLLRASVDYNSFIKGDLIQTTLDLLSGLQGNSQAVQKFGLNLSQTSVQAKLMSKRINASVRSLTDAEKVQIRLNVVTDKYPKILGLAAAQTSTVAGTLNLLSSRLSDATVEFGRGASIIENFAISQRLAINSLEFLNPLVIQSAGFISALGGRILQIGGFFLKFAFIISIVLTSIKALNFALGTQTVRALIRARTTILGTTISFQRILNVLAGTRVRLRSVADAFKFLGKTAVFQSKRIIASLLGVQVSTLSLGTAIRGLGRRIVQLGRSLLTLALNPVVLTLAAIAAAGFVLFKAFQQIEERTGAVSLIFTNLVGIFDDLFETIFGGIGLIETLSNAIKAFVSTTLGLLVAGFARILQGLVKAINALPNAIVSADRKAKFREADKSLSALARSLQRVNFAISELPDAADKANRGIAGIKIPTTLPKDLQRLQKSLANVGLTELQQIKKTRDVRLMLIQVNLDKQLVSEQAAAKLRIKVLQDFSIRAAVIEKKRFQQIKQIAEQFGGAEALRLREAERLIILQKARGAELLTEQEFQAAKQQIELESLRAQSQNKLLSEQEFQLQKEAIIIEAERRRLNTILNNAFLVEGIQRDSSLRSLFFEQKILQEKLKNENLTARQRLEIERRLQKGREEISRQNLNNAQGLAGDLMTLAAGSNKELFNLAKNASLAIATVKGFQAVQNALADVPFPANLLAAAAIAARTAVQIQGISRTNFQRGGEVPPGFPNDSFPANLTSGENVIDRSLSRRLDDSLEREERDEGNKKILEALNVLIELQSQTIDMLGNLEMETTVNVGNREIFRELRAGQREGRALAV